MARINEMLVGRRGFLWQLSGGLWWLRVGIEPAILREIPLKMPIKSVNPDRYELKKFPLKKWVLKPGEETPQRLMRYEISYGNPYDNLVERSLKLLDFYVKNEKKDCVEEWGYVLRRMEGVKYGCISNLEKDLPAVVMDIMEKLADVTDPIRVGYFRSDGDAIIIFPEHILIRTYYEEQLRKLKGR